MDNSAIRRGCHVAVLLALLAVILCPCRSFAQTEAASIYGRVSDQSGAVIPDAEVKLHNIDTGIDLTRTSNHEGFYLLPALKPGRYLMVVSKQGFKTVTLKDITLNVQENVSRNFSLEVGSTSESVTVNAEAATINTTDATVSTVVDRQFADNLPLNGRSFQTLINLAPGVVLTPSSTNDGGQFSVNGQRASSNYWMVDGVGANIGAAPSFVPGNGTGGALFGFSAQGGTNSLVSVDAMQEFRIQTSTYAPEFGRTPGGQISIVTRSGANQLHGSVYDYLRNDILDANDWFGDHLGLPKPEERQNDFGGTFSGPILRNRTFFFFSYEGLRLRLPQVAQTKVPTMAARQSASPDLQPFFNAFPLPNGPQAVDPSGNPIAGAAQFNKSFSNKSTLDAYSLRIDHKLSGKLSLFGRYNYSPSENVARGQFAALNQLSPSDITTQTATGGATWTISPTLVNDLRLNYSRSNAAGSQRLDGFGGGAPLSSLPLPGGFSSLNAYFSFDILSLGNNPGYIVGRTAHNLQRQLNLVENLSLQKGSHSLKFGMDYRRLTPVFDPPGYTQQDFFSDVSSAENGSLLQYFITSNRTETFLFRDLGIFAQDTWKATPRLTLTYGLRWDLDVAPATTSGASFPAVSNFNLNNLSTLTPAPAGTPPYKTPYRNFAPRIGVAYELSQKPGWGRVLRGGFGLFYDLATQEFGNNLNAAVYPFGAGNFVFGGTFPLDSGSARPPTIVAPSPSNPGPTFVFDPNLNLPYTLEFNLALQQGLGTQQALTATYTGASGKRLIGTALVFLPPGQTFSAAQIVSNAATSNYNALQLEFNRRLSRGLQILASYTWSHSIDTGSASSLGNSANGVVPTLNPNQNRGDSDFDMRGKATLGLSYNIPAPELKGVAQTLLKGWSLETNALIQSAPPVNVYDGLIFQLLNGVGGVRPDVTPGIPLYLSGSQYPGDRAINFTPGAVAGGCPDGSTSVGPFCPPPVDSTTGAALRQGNLGRNTLRGYRAAQWDFGVHRSFPIRESLKMQFRAEMFNLLNHPNFAPPVSDITNAQFGQSTMMLGQYLGANVGSGGFSPLYQIGGPRSIQLALKLEF